MATEIYRITNSTLPHITEDSLNKEGMKSLCRRYNQPGAEVDAFLNRFDYDLWTPLVLDIEDRYSPSNDPDAFLDSSAPSLLGIIMNSLTSDEGLKKMTALPDMQLDSLGVPRFDMDEEALAERFVEFENCPLWICRIIRLEQFRVEALVLLPEDFIGDAGIMSDSAAFPYIVTNKGSANSRWYSWEKHLECRIKRVGKYSDKFLKTGTLDIPQECEDLVLDREKNTLFMRSSSGCRMISLDEPGLSRNLDIKAKGIIPTDDGYRIYTEKALVLTDRELKETGRMDSKSGLFGGNEPLNEYCSENWEVMITNRGISLHHTATGNRAETKLSDYKLKASDAKRDRLLILGTPETLYLADGKSLRTIGSDLSCTNTSLKKYLKKGLEPYIKDAFLYRAEKALFLNDKPLFFVDGIVYSVNEKGEPVLMNEVFQSFCGEFSYHSACADPARKGIWALAGLERIVYITETMDRAVVFNTEGIEEISAYMLPWMEMDREGNLLFSTGFGIRKVDSGELESKLPGVL